MKTKLRICYFAPLESIHTIRWLNYFSSLGHDIYAYTGMSIGFEKWTNRSRLVNENWEESKIKSFDNPQLIRYMTKPINHFPKLRKPLDLLRSELELLRRKQWMRNQINEVMPNIVHALWLGDNAYNAWLTSIHPMLITIWGSDIRRISTKSIAKQERLRRALTDADAITSDSDELLALCQSWGAIVDRCHRIGVPGIDVDRFSKPQRTDLLEQFGISANTRVILSCRAIQPLYRIHNIIAAFQYLHKEMSDTLLLLITYNPNPEYLKKIEVQIQKTDLQDRVLLVDSMPYDEMPELYASSDVMVSIPEMDGMPQSAYESLAAGCPIVASDLSTYNGIIDDEYSGLRVSGDNIQEIAMAILRLLQDDALHARLSSNGRQIVKKRGDICEEMAKMELLYYDLLCK